MRHPSARLQHQAGHPAHRDVRPDAILVHDHERTVEHVDLTLLDEDDRHSVLDRDRLQGREHRVGLRKGSGTRPEASSKEDVVKVFE